MEKPMDTESKIIYEELSKEVTWLNLKWACYVELYESKESHIDLMNEAAPEFFSTIQELLLESIILNIARLCDPASTRIKGKIIENLSIGNLIESLKDVSYCSTINNLLDEAKNIGRFARFPRNKYIAHLGKKEALEQGNMLDKVTKDEIEKAINDIVSVMNCIGDRYFDSTHDYSGDNGQICAESILHIINDGILHEKEIINKRKNARTYEEAELKPDEI
jgi:hypothetical protein